MEKRHYTKEEVSDWESRQPTRKLPSYIRRYFIEEANYLTGELINNKLSVILISHPDYPDGEVRLRSVETRNPRWYSELFSSYSYKRNRLNKMRNQSKARKIRKNHRSVRSLYGSVIERRRSLNALERIANEGDREAPNRKANYFDEIFRSLILDRLLRGYRIERYFCEELPNEEVVGYFESLNEMDVG